VEESHAIVLASPLEDWMTGTLEEWNALKESLKG
jgi:hypothetical protein